MVTIHLKKKRKIYSPVLRIRALQVEILPWWEGSLVRGRNWFHSFQAHR